VVLTTHYLEEAEHLADRVVIVDHGRAIAAGHPSELVANPRLSHLHFTTAPDLDVGRLLARLPDGSTVVEVSPGSYQVVTQGLADALTPVTVWFTELGVSPTSINSERRTLEDVFLELTSEDHAP